MHKLGFTSIELVFAVGYTFTLLYTAVNGLAVAQMTYRDNARREAVANMSTAIDAYQIKFGAYPAKLSVSENGAAITLSETERIPLANPAAALAQETESTTQATVYCYKLTDRGYVVGADLEDIGQTEQASDDTLHCNWQTDLVR